jgi:hypothetical protein
MRHAAALRTAAHDVLPRCICTGMRVTCTVCRRTLISVKLKRHTRNVHCFGAFCCDTPFRSWQTLWNHVVTVHYRSGRPINIRYLGKLIHLLSVTILCRSRSIDQSIREESSIESGSELSYSSLSESNTIASGGLSGIEDWSDSDNTHSTTITKLSHLPFRPKLPGRKFLNYVKYTGTSLKSLAIADLSRRLRKHHITVDAYKSLFFDSIISKTSGLATHLKKFKITTIQPIFRHVSKIHHANQLIYRYSQIN